MTRSFLTGSLVALMLAFGVQSVLRIRTPPIVSSATAAAADVAAPVAPDPITVAIDDLAAWPAAAAR